MIALHHTMCARCLASLTLGLVLASPASAQSLLNAQDSPAKETRAIRTAQASAEADATPPQAFESEADSPVTLTDLEQPADESLPVLAVSQPAAPATPTTPRATPRSSARPTRRQGASPQFSQLASVPNLFGDFFSGNLVASGLCPSSTYPSSALWNDGVPYDYYVESTNGNPGAEIGYGIVIRNSADNQEIAHSIGAGSDTSGDTIPDTFAISDPTGGQYLFLGGSAYYVGVSGANSSTTAASSTDDDGWNISFNYQDPGACQIHVPAGGGAAARRVKISENNSPLPKDRLFFNYNHFAQVIGFGDVNRYTFGAESTFDDGEQSLEVRGPIASTLNSEQQIGGGDLTNTEIGNVTVTWKNLLYYDSTSVFAVGLGVGVPTGDDVEAQLADGTPVLRIENDSWHLLPYMAYLRRFGDYFFVQGFAQLDLDPFGNPTLADTTGAGLRRIGVMQDPDLLFLDLSLGCILYENRAATISQIAPALELHYSTTMDDGDRVSGNGVTLQEFTRRYDVLNLTAGVHFNIGERLTVSPGFVTPLRGGDDEVFDYEASVLANMWF